MNNPILVTGAAGFIGFHLCKKLLQSDYEVLGIDNVNDYYDRNLKENRLKILGNISLKKNNWKFIKTDLIDKDNILEIFEGINLKSLLILLLNRSKIFLRKSKCIHIFKYCWIF